MAVTHEHTNMYTMEIIKTGMEFLGISDPTEILDSRNENLAYIHEKNVHTTTYKAWENRFKVPLNLTKKELTDLKKETQVHIDHLLNEIRKCTNDGDKIFLTFIQDDYITKKEAIKRALSFSGKQKNMTDDITRAKAYPIDRLLEFNTAGFTKCPYHSEKTGSCKFYEKRNKVHCFSCSGDFDSIDIYMCINNVSFSEAIKKLCQSR